MSKFEIFNPFHSVVGNLTNNIILLGDGSYSAVYRSVQLEWIYAILQKALFNGFSPLFLYHVGESVFHFIQRKHSRLEAENVFSTFQRIFRFVTFGIVRAKIYCFSSFHPQVQC